MSEMKHAVSNILEDLEGFTLTEVTYILTEVRNKVQEPKAKR